MTQSSRATLPSQYPARSQTPTPISLPSPQVAQQHPLNYQQPPPYQHLHPYQIPQHQIPPYHIPQPQMPPHENPNVDSDADNEPPMDYDEMVEYMLGLPGREHLPRLSRTQIPGVETIWFGRDKGKLSRTIAGIFRAKFDGPYFSWKVTPISIQQRYFKAFAGKFNWDIGLTELVREGFLVIAKKRLKGIVSQAKK